MPRWASRITLEVTNVRVERLQDISDVDAIAEGCDDTHITETHPPSQAFRKPTPREAFRVLWDSIYGKKDGCPWVDNPLVWVIEFKVLGEQVK
ncbi:hypothetical protein [Chrysiogenes arsenatis]|uniref:hypothetical protein n=1 Tax=Chrysiogenes arsenatis TaxID=309797 RepID=UPI00191BD941|nr:hypothetical protein [Chrysiogenes arsenatis]